LSEIPKLTASCFVRVSESHCFYGSANLLERQFPDPERFDLDRRGAHVGWGYGAHACVGMHLSKLEMEALLSEMIPRVELIELISRVA
jgi:cytochrome P450